MKIKVDCLEKGEVELSISSLKAVEIENDKGTFDDFESCALKICDKKELLNAIMENCDGLEFIDIIKDWYNPEDLVRVWLDDMELELFWQN